MINLMNEPEIFEYDKKKGQILDANAYVENAHIGCWICFELLGRELCV